MPTHINCIRLNLHCLKCYKMLIINFYKQSYLYVVYNCLLAS